MVSALPELTETVQAVLLTNYEGSARYLSREDPVGVTAEVIATLTKLVQDYTGTTVDGSDPIYAEMASMFFRSFGHMGVHELKEAFRLGSAGQISGVTHESFSAWYGRFSVASLGLILSSYDIHRATVARRIDEAERKIKLKSEIEEKQSYWQSPQGQEEIAANNAARVAELISMPSPNLDSVTQFDFDMLCSLGLINLENFPVERRWQIMGDAQARVLADLKLESLSGKTEGARLGAQRLADAVTSGLISEVFDDRAKVVARRMAVLHWISDQKQNTVSN